MEIGTGIAIAGIALALSIAYMGGALAEAFDQHSQRQHNVD